MSMGSRCKELIAKAHSDSLAEHFFALPTNLQTETNSFLGRRLIPAIDEMVASLFPLSADWPSAISYFQRGPIDINKPHILAYGAEISFLQSKERGPFKFNNKKSAV
jgi:hypothetical protein